MEQQDKQHYDNGGSQIYKRWKCPGSRILERRVKDDPKHVEEVQEYTIRGTRIHHYSEYIIPALLEAVLNGLVTHREKILEEALQTSKGSEFPLSVAEVEEVEFAWEYSRHVFKRCEDAGAISNKTFTYKLEPKVILDRKLELGGSIDFVGIWEEYGAKKCIIEDLKTGYADTDLMQQELYACALQEELDWELDEISVGIYQPNASVPTKRTQEKTYTKLELLEKKKFFLDVAKKTFQKNAETLLQVDTKGCMFCLAANNTCPAQTKHNYDLAVSVLNAEEGTLMGDNMPTIEDLPSLIANTPEERLIQIKKNADLIKKTLQQVDKYFINKEQQGESVESIRVVKGRGKRSINNKLDVKLVKKTFKERYGVTAVTKESLRGIGELETKLKKKGYELKQIKQIMDEFTTPARSSPVPIYDPEGEDNRPNFYGEALLEEAKKVFPDE